MLVAGVRYSHTARLPHGGSRGLMHQALGDNKNNKWPLHGAERVRKKGKRKTELTKLKFCSVLKNEIPLVSLMSSQSQGRS